jgi:glycosyltransferase involved in cell wall biosynthesis
VGAPAAHYDDEADARAKGLAARVRVTGFVPETELGAYLAAIDVCACLRWPTNHETSASWWRAMAAGRPTLVTDLSHQPEIPVVDPRGWRPLGRADEAPVAVAVPILDEHQGIVAALDTLIRNGRARAAMGDAARAYWHAHHTLDAMADAYAALLADAAEREAPIVALPPHLRVAGDERLTALLAPFGVAPRVPA